jgi:MerR family mercuric resistance operon transcriptional regulator
MRRDREPGSDHGRLKPFGRGNFRFGDLAAAPVQHRSMRIGELAKSADVSVETIRYYQRIGLLELPQKPYGGFRSYGSHDLKRLRFIRRAQQIGFSLEDIRALLELSSSDCTEVARLATEKLNVVHGKIRELRRMESVLAKTVEQCVGRKGNQPCPIIETLSQSESSR